MVVLVPLGMISIDELVKKTLPATEILLDRLDWKNWSIVLLMPVVLLSTLKDNSKVMLVPLTKVVT